MNLFARAFQQFKERLILRGIMLDGQAARAEFIDELLQRIGLIEFDQPRAAARGTGGC